MKAYISAQGYLVVIPENETEHFALRAWFQRFPHEGNYGDIKDPTGLAIESYIKPKEKGYGNNGN